MSVSVGGRNHLSSGEESAEDEDNSVSHFAQSPTRSTRGRGVSTKSSSGGAAQERQSLSLPMGLSRFSNQQTRFTDAVTNSSTPRSYLKAGGGGSSYGSDQEDGRNWGAAGLKHSHTAMPSTSAGRVYANNEDISETGYDIESESREESRLRFTMSPSAGGMGTNPRGAMHSQSPTAYPRPPAPSAISMRQSTASSGRHQRQLREDEEKMMRRKMEEERNMEREMQRA